MPQGHQAPAHQVTTAPKEEKKKLTREQRKAKKAWKEYEEASADEAKAELKGNSAAAEAARKRKFEKMGEYFDYKAIERDKKD